MEVGLIGSFTNSSYQDLSRAASIARQVDEKQLSVAAPLIVKDVYKRQALYKGKCGCQNDFL